MPEVTNLNRSFRNTSRKDLKLSKLDLSRWNPIKLQQALYTFAGSNATYLNLTGGPSQLVKRVGFLTT